MAKLFENNASGLGLMPVTFIIGNGFDLSLKMKTSYGDIYESYVKTESNSKVIEAFKSDLANRRPYDKWSDFEMGMSIYARSLASEDELIECVRDFKRHMVAHLRCENKRATELIKDNDYAEDLIKELDRSFEQFHMGFAPNIVDKISRLIGGPMMKYNVITFNYTSTMEALLSVKARKQKVPINAPLHIHGSLDKDVVLGIDSIQQFMKVPYSLSNRGERAFIKTVFNEQYDRARVAAAKKTLSESSVICTYGFSMGETDRTWVDTIIEWLRCDPEHHLVSYQYDKTQYDYYNFDEIMDTEEVKKEVFMEHIGLADRELLDQIHIPVGYDLFNFEFKKVIGQRLPR